MEKLPQNLHNSASTPSLRRATRANRARSRTAGWEPLATVPCCWEFSGADTPTRNQHYFLQQITLLKITSFQLWRYFSAITMTSAYNCITAGWMWWLLMENLQVSPRGFIVCFILNASWHWNFTLNSTFSSNQTDFFLNLGDRIEQIWSCSCSSTP